MPVSLSNKGIRAALTSLIATAVAVGTVAGQGHAAAQVAQGAVDGAHLPVALQRANPAPMPTIGQPAPEKNPNASVTLNSLHRDSVGLVTLTWTMVYNASDESFVVPPALVSVYKYAGTSASAVTLTDEAGKIRYNPLRMDPSATCICTDMPSIPNGLSKGQSAILNEVYKLPANVNAVTVSIPGYSPAKSIPVN